MSASVTGYYGKLPVSPEFLRRHAAGPELREIDEWFERGVQHAKAKAGSEWPALVAQADIWNFLFVPEGNGRVVCGAVFASRDQVGRSFPFLVFLLLDRGDLPPTSWLIPLRCREFLAKTRQLLQQLRANLDWNTFRTGVESQSAEVNRDASIEAGFEEYLSYTTTSEFWSRLCASADPPQYDGLGHERAIHLHSAVAQYGEEETWGRHLPLLKRHTTETYDLAFWLELHARLYAVKKRTWSKLFAFWNRAPSKVEPCVLLSFGRPSPNLTRFIVSPDVKDEAWCEGLPQQASVQADATNVSLRQYLDSIR